MTNTLMFTFLSSFVSYDNLTNLMAAMAVYYLLAFFKTRSGDLLAATFLCQLAGSLTKFSFLPLVVILNLLLVIHEFKTLRVLPSALLSWFKAARWRRWVLTLGIFFGLALNIQLYGGNYYYYRDLSPEMATVLSPEIAMQNRLAARTLILSAFKEGRISREEALAMALQIKFPGDRADTIFLINTYDDLRNKRIELLGPLAYGAFWVQHMSAGIFGIFGHLHMFNEGPTIWPFALLGGLTGLSILIRWRPSDAAWLPTCLMAIAVFFGLFLFYYVNYPTYLATGVDLTVQGRYLFPIMGVIYVVCSYYLPRLFRSRSLQMSLAALACIIFIASDFPYFLAHVDSRWFIPLFG
jgi:hypothetical protein